MHAHGLGRHGGTLRARGPCCPCTSRGRRAQGVPCAPVSCGVHARELCCPCTSRGGVHRCRCTGAAVCTPAGLLHRGPAAPAGRPGRRARRLDASATIASWTSWSSARSPGSTRGRSAGRADAPDRSRHRAATVDRGRVLRQAAPPDGPPVRGAGHHRGQPADRPVLRRGRRARRHAGAARRRPGPGPRLGRVDHDPVLRRAHRDRPDRAAAGAAARADLDYQLDRMRTPSCSRRTGDLRLELAVAPMLGTSASLPGREVRSSLVPDNFGSDWTPVPRHDGPLG